MIMAVLNYLDDVLYYPILMVILIAAGLIFSWKTRCVQLRLFPESIRVVMEKPTEAGKVSSFQALMVSTASRVGTGNIIGVSTAICLGGPGAVFWMWLLAIIGGATAFIESTLAQIYKRRNPLGHSYGGPAYYIETAMHKRWLGVLFAFSLIVTYAGGFNLLCSFNMQSTFLVYSFYDPTTTPWIIGAIFAALVAYCLIGGGQRIIKVTSVLVPLMGGIYILAALIVIVFHITSLPQVFAMIFADAFDFQSIPAACPAPAWSTVSSAASIPTKPVSVRHRMQQPQPMSAIRSNRAWSRCCRSSSIPSWSAVLRLSWASSRACPSLRK